MQGSKMIGPLSRKRILNEPLQPEEPIYVAVLNVGLR